MKLMRALKDKEMDIRLREKLVFDGSIKEEEVDKYLESLPDDSENATYIEEITPKNRG